MDERASESPQPGSETAPGASFSALVITLALSAMEQLGSQVREGEASEPRTAKPELAKPIIDSLEILRDKTKGNLTTEESELLDAVICDLRLRYLKAIGTK